MKDRLRLGIVIAVSCLVSARGQDIQKGPISGVVRAVGGLGISQARITGDCISASTETDERGVFTIDAAQEGCRIQVRADGFQVAQTSIQRTGEPLLIELAVDPLQQTVTVMESSPLVQSNPEISTAIDTKTLSELPSSIRDINRFAMLDPRVRNSGSLASDGIYGTRLTMNGQLFRYTQYTVDGATNYEPVLGNGPQQVLSIASVAEYKVMVNQYSAEYGRSSAGIISAITRTGTDQWHGEGFYFGRPSGIQAAPPVSTFRLPNERQMWGGAIGGPLGRDYHLFASVEGNTQTRGAYIQSPVPGFYPGHQKQWFGLINLDKRWNDRQSLYLRLNAHSSKNDNSNDAVGGFVQPSAARRDSGQNLGLQATHRWILTPESTNEFRFGASKGIPLSYYAVTPQTQIVRPSYSTEGLSDYFDTRVQTYQASDVYSWIHGAHQIRAGGDYIRNIVRDFNTSLFGSYRMAAGAPKAGEVPVQFTQTFGAQPVHYGDTLASWFVQDDWRLHPKLTLNLGLRYEYQSTAGDTNNFAPRFGFAWDLDGKGKTVIRGGAGLYYDQIFLQVVRGALQNGPASGQVTYTLPYGVAGFPTFPSSLSAPPQGAGDRRDLTLLTDHRLNPSTGQFTLGVQRVIAGDWTLTVNVSHMISHKQLRALDLNAPSIFVRTAAGQRRSATVADKTRPMTYYDGVPVRTVGLIENTGSSRYTAWDVQIAKRFSRHFQLMAHYLNSSSVTYTFFTGGPNTGVPSDWNNPSKDERGPSDYHQRHRVTGQALVELPWHLQFNTFVIAASGLPVNPLTGVDNNGDGNVADRPAGLGRNSFRAPMQATVDASMMRRFALSERAKLELRLEGTNLFNRSNFLRVNTTYGDGATPLASFLGPVAGVSNSDPARQLQVGLRLTF